MEACLPSWRRNGTLLKVIYDELDVMWDPHTSDGEGPIRPHQESMPLQATTKFEIRIVSLVTVFNTPLHLKISVLTLILLYIKVSTKLRHLFWDGGST